MKTTPFHPSHLGAMRPISAAERALVESVTPEYAARLAAEPSITLWANDRPIACGGVLGGVEAWCVVDAECRSHKLWAVKEARKFLSQFPWVYARVNTELEDGCRLLEVLGFQWRGYRTRAGIQQNHFERAA